MPDVRDWFQSLEPEARTKLLGDLTRLNGGEAPPDAAEQTELTKERLVEALRALSPEDLTEVTKEGARRFDPEAGFRNHFERGQTIRLPTTKGDGVDGLVHSVGTDRMVIHALDKKPPKTRRRRKHGTTEGTDPKGGAASDPPKGHRSGAGKQAQPDPGK